MVFRSAFHCFIALKKTDEESTSLMFGTTKLNRLKKNLFFPGVKISYCQQVSFCNSLIPFLNGICQASILHHMKHLLALYKHVQNPISKMRMNTFLALKSYVTFSCLNQNKNYFKICHVTFVKIEIKMNQIQSKRKMQEMTLVFLLQSIKSNAEVISLEKQEKWERKKTGKEIKHLNPGMGSPTVLIV